MRWLIVFIGLFIIMYVFGIIRAVLRLGSLEKLLNKIDLNLNLIATAIDKNMPNRGGWNYNYNDEVDSFLQKAPQKEYLGILISLKPEIKEFLSSNYHCARISYNKSSIDNYENLLSTYNDLLMESNHLALDVKHSLNPKFTVKNLFLLPSTLLSLVGISFEKTTAANLFSSITWIAGFIIKNYGDAIKTTIGELLLK